MVKRRFGIVILLLCFCLCAMPCQALAASTTDAKELISIGNTCSLTISYDYEGITFPGQSVKLYKIAEVSADFQYTLAAPFVSSGLILNGIQTNGEWNIIRSTLETLVLANNITPNLTTTTDESGQARFEELRPGLYLASAVTVVQNDLTCAFDAALVSLPGLGADGYWQYDIAISAKPEVLPPVDPDEEIQLKVLKLWKGDEKRADRPSEIEIEIFRNGSSFQMILLSEENHWSYTWTAKDDGASWKVVERNVPSGYAMTIEQRENTFIITNSRSDQPDSPPPQTGDTTNLLLYTVMMYVSGTILILLGVVGKRKRHEETN